MAGNECSNRAIRQTVPRLPGQHKISTKGVVPPTTIEKPTTPWTKVAIDVTGPFATAPRHQQNIVVVIDYYSNFPEVLLTDAHDTRTVVKWLSQLFGRYGNPDVLVSDNGPEFRSNDFGNFCRARGIFHHRTPVYTPQENGLVEVFNRSLKHHVQATCREHKPFDVKIGELLARFRAERPSPGRLSPGELFLGRRLRLPFEPSRYQRTPEEESHSTEEEVEEPRSTNRENTRGPFKVGDAVRTKRRHVLKGETPWSEQLRVSRVLGRYTYVLSDGQKWNQRLLKLVVKPLPVVVELPADPPLRRSTRTTRGRPPRCLSPS